MIRFERCFVGLGLLFGLLFASAQERLKPIPEIERRIPPVGIEVPEEVVAELEDAIRQLTPKDDKAVKDPVKEGVRAAFELALKHGEFYKLDDFKKIKPLLEYALDPPEIDMNKPKAGRYITAYPSSIDGSWQPMALEVPEQFNPLKPRSMVVWLHGRGDKVTNLHFLHERLTKPGKLPLEKLPNTLVLHPFGRHCMGFKGPGEIDVLEATRLVAREFRIDQKRIALMGFSMGGAGVWHIGAHYPDQWCFVGPGAGFAETKEYTKLKPADYPPQWEQTLWGVYDVPNYVGNLFNMPVVAYSGEDDKQIQAARVMERAFQARGKELTHLIGPKTGHTYHPDSLDELLKQASTALSRRTTYNAPTSMSLQTRTLRYNKAKGIDILEVEKQWDDTRVDIETELKPKRRLKVTTKNVKKLQFSTMVAWQGPLVIDGQQVRNAGRIYGVFEKADGTWKSVGYASSRTMQKKKIHGLQGPIDDAFLSRFYVGVPEPMEPESEVSAKEYFAKTPPVIRQWLEFEVEHLRERWSALYRAKLPEHAEVEKFLNQPKKNVVLWGTPMDNDLVSGVIRRSPVSWDEEKIEVDGTTWDAKHHILAMIYPTPYLGMQQGYVVLNSGPTFREDHDRTNSLQNPKLPDWAVIDVREAPSGSSPGKVVAAGFFDENWGFGDE